MGERNGGEMQRGRINLAEELVSMNDENFLKHLASQTDIVYSFYDEYLDTGKNTAKKRKLERNASKLEELIVEYRRRQVSDNNIFILENAIAVLSRMQFARIKKKK